MSCFIQPYSAWKQAVILQRNLLVSISASVEFRKAPFWVPYFFKVDTLFLVHLKIISSVCYQEIFSTQKSVFIYT